MPYRTTLTSVDRWRVQNSDTVIVKVSDTTIRINQQVSPSNLCSIRSHVFCQIHPH